MPESGKDMPAWATDHAAALIEIERLRARIIELHRTVADLRREIAEREAAS